MEHNELLELIKSSPDQRIEAIFTHKNGEKKRLRLAIAEGGTQVLVLAKGRKRYGHTLRRFKDCSIGQWEVVSIEPIAPPDPAEVWEKSWRKVLEHLEESGLFPEVADSIRRALEMGYETVQEQRKLYDSGEYTGREERFLKVAHRLMLRPKDGRIDYDILWHMYYPAQVKRMYFGKRMNTTIHELIEEAMKNRTPYRSAREYNGSYDASFCYHPEINNATYSEEYKDCGNGHYYLAIGAHHAVFWEDD
jgi:hypothetical protein